jgi:hypothetical protein
MNAMRKIRWTDIEIAESADIAVVIIIRSQSTAFVAIYIEGISIGKDLILLNG